MLGISGPRWVAVLSNTLAEIPIQEHFRSRPDAVPSGHGANLGARVCWSRGVLGSIVGHPA